MLDWAEQVLHAVANAKTETELFREVLLAAQAIGFEYCAYGMRFSVPIARPRHVLVNNYPIPWQSRYEEMGYIHHDPTVMHGLKCQDPILWNDDLFISAPQLWSEAKEAGLRVGWAQASPMRNGVGGMLSLARSHDPLLPSELNAIGLRLPWLANIAHMGFLRMLDAKDILCPELKLTPREKEVLRWSADGKTIPDISQILLISEDTVKFHTRNVLCKMDVTNRTAAVARAAFLGLLD